jgi:hypothetical protein
VVDIVETVVEIVVGWVNVEVLVSWTVRVSEEVTMTAGKVVVDVEVVEIVVDIVVETVVG